MTRVQEKVMDQLWLLTSRSAVNQIHCGAAHSNKLGSTLTEKRREHLHFIGDNALIFRISRLALAFNLLVGGAALVGSRFAKASRSRTLVSRAIGISTVVLSTPPSYGMFTTTRTLSAYGRKELETLIKNSKEECGKC